MSNQTEICEFCKNLQTCITLSYNSFCNIYGCKNKSKHDHKLCKGCRKDHKDALEWLDFQDQNLVQPSNSAILSTSKKRQKKKLK